MPMTTPLKLQMTLTALGVRRSRRQFNRRKDAEHYIKVSPVKLHLTTVWHIDPDKLTDSKSAGWTYTRIENVH